MRTFHCLAAVAAAALLFAGCGEPRREAEAPPLAVAGLPPVAFLAGRIAGPDCRVTAVLPPGRSPHDFTARPNDVRSIAAAGLFLQVGEIFEQNIVKSLSDGKAVAVDVSKGIRRLPMEAGHGHRHGEAEDHKHEDHHHDHAHGPDCSCSADGMDPHVWLSPGNCIVIARNIAEALSAAEPARRAEFERNCDALIAELEAVDAEMKARLKPYAGRTFFVYHPAFGYLAEAMGLRQRGIELGGRDPAPARLAEAIREAKELQVRTIFVQPQFNPVSGKALAEAIGGVTAALDPVAPDVIANFRTITDKLLEGFANQP